MTEQLSYPIGRHQGRPSYTADERTALIDRLAAQPKALAAALSGLPEVALETPYRPGGWTVRQLVHHVADSHINMFIRVKFALAEHEPTVKPYDENVWAFQSDATTVAPAVSVALLHALHERAVVLFRSLDDEQFRRGLLHPENGRMTIEQVLALYAWHGDHHIAHLTAMRQRNGV